MTQTQEHNVPAQRFPEFSGEWDSLKLGDIAAFSKGKGISKADISEDGAIECIRYGQLYTDYGETIEEIKSRTSVPASELVLSEANDIIIPASGETQIDIATASCVLKDGVALGGDLNIVKTSNNGVFLSYYLNSKRKIDIARLSQGISVVHLYAAQLKTLHLNLPDAPEQQKIASFLSQVDCKIAQLAEKKALLQAYKKGMMQKLFSQELRFKDPQGYDFPDWEEKRLGEVAEFVGGGTPETGKPEYWGGEIQWFTPTEIKQKYLSGSKRTITKLGLQKSSAKLLPVGALLLSTRATVGDIGIATKECTTNQGFQSLIVNSENINEFWYYWILENKKTLLRRSSGSTFLEISKTEIAKIKADKPSLSEQQKIADFLSSIDRKIDLVSSELDHAKTFKKGLLQQMFI